MGGEVSKETGPIIHKLPAERAGESEIYRRAKAKDNLIARYEDNITTLYESFTDAATKFPDNKCLGWRIADGPYTWISYRSTQERSLHVGSGLVRLGMIPHKEKIGIYAINRPEWIITETATNSYSFCLVPLYDTLGADVCSYIVTQSEIRTVICAPDKTKLLLNATDGMKSLTTIIHFEKVDEEIQALAQSKNIKLMSFDDLEASGKENPVPVDPPKHDELCTICYTSGTTGLPKGVILTHGNFIANVAGAFHNGLLLQPGDVHISYLPLAHVLERLVSASMLYRGGSIGFYRGDVRKLFDDIQLLRPTIFPSVPRVYNRLFDKVMSKIDETGGISKSLFENAFEAKKDGLKEGYITHSVWDALVFSKVQQQLGGRVRLMLTGSAPISDKVMEFLRICFACPVVEGYGQTESSAGICSTLLWDTTTGHVGVPMACCEIKLVDVPEMNYLSKDDPPRGEICFRGPSSTAGYYKDPEKTAELIDSNGWLHTGDIGTVLPSGMLKVIDRKKNIFKISLGEYIAPEKLENIFVQSKWVSQCFVYGDSLKATIVAIIVPDPEPLKEWATAQSRADAGDLAALCKDPQVLKMIQDDMVAVGKGNQLRGFEFPSKVTLVADAFSIENDLLTPTFKLKRPQAKAFFQAHINKMYENAE